MLARILEKMTPQDAAKYTKLLSEQAAAQSEQPAAESVPSATEEAAAQ